jgi:arylsulfatase A-like enzyme
MTRRQIIFAVLAGVAAVIIFAYAVGVRPGWARTESARTAPSIWPASPPLTDVGTKPSHPLNVILISIDTLRADHMSLFGYDRPTTPRIDAFADDARVFERAYATTSFTTPSVVSMLTGLYPYRHGVRLLWQPLDDKVVTLPEWLRNAGYQTAAVVSNLVLADEGSGLGRRFDHYDNRVDDPETNRPDMLERRAGPTTDAAMQWVAKRGESRQPFFLWVHYIDPHGPYEPPADADTSFKHDGELPIDPERVAEYVHDPTVTDMLDYVDRYDGEIRYTDREVGRLLDGLAKANLLDDALVILTADHGEYLLERPEFAFCHGFGVDEAVIRVPLIVRVPKTPPARITAPVSIVDITPTIFDALGMTTRATFDGKSLLGDCKGRTPYAEGPDPLGSGGRERALIAERFKWVLRHGMSNITRDAWAFDLFTDPLEQQRLPVDPNLGAYRVLDRLIRHDDAGSAVANSDAQDAARQRLLPHDVSAETLEKLRGLGYVE